MTFSSSEPPQPPRFRPGNLLVPSIVSVQVEPVVPEFEFAAEQSPDQPKKVSV
jgi:hypothetical protein